MPAVVGVNSYSDNSHAKTFFDNQFGADEYLSASTDVQDRALVTATLIIDQYFTFRGNKAVETDTLEWPRLPDGEYTDSFLDGINIPEDIRKAQRELALHLLKNPDVLSNGTTYRKLKTGTRELEDPVMASLIPPLVDRILEKYLVRESYTGVGNIL